MAVRFGFSLQGRGALADRETITTLARRAEALGYDSIWVTDRLLIPVESRSAYPYSSTGAFPLGPDEPWLESLTAITYLATATQRITVGTSVLVIPYRNPIWIGGPSEAALRRVVAVGDGWHPLGLRPPVTLDPPEMAAKVGRLRTLAAAAGRNPEAITISFKAPLKLDAGVGAGRRPLTGSPPQIVEDLQAYVKAGVRHFVLDFSITTKPEMIETLERFAAEVRPSVRG